MKPAPKVNKKWWNFRTPRDIIEMSVYGVCAFWGRKLHMPSKKVRMYFVYASFLTMGSPIIIYLTMAFVLNLRNMIRSKRNPVWDI
jgi:phage shock protein PspC (stress-responsive transcriptional regulator)